MINEVREVSVNGGKASITWSPLKSAIESLQSYASLSVTNNTTATTITTTDVFVKIAGVTQQIEATSNFTVADNRLTYTGSDTKKFQYSFTICGTTTTNNITYSVKVFKNGASIDESLTCADFHTANRMESLSGSGFVELATNDYVEIWMANNDATQDPTVRVLSLSLVAV